MTASPPFDHDGTRGPLLVICCVAYRFIGPLVDWLHAQDLRGRYDLRTHEGAALAVDQWADSAVVIDRLHSVEGVWIVDHDDCGAYRLLGEPNTRDNHVLHLKRAQARLQARLGKPVRVFYQPLGADGFGGPPPEEILP